MRVVTVQDFASGLAADNMLAASSVSLKETVPLGEIVELMASARALYDVATLTSRELDRVKDCYTLWYGVHAEFEGLCQAWDGVPQNGELVSWHRAQLEHLRELAQDRVELYNITERERRAHAKCKESEMRDPEPHPAVLKDFSKREVAHIDAALNRRLHSH